MRAAVRMARSSSIVVSERTAPTSQLLYHQGQNQTLLQSDQALCLSAAD